MAIKDYHLDLSDGQALTAAGATASTNVIDLGVVKDAFDSSIYGEQGGALWINVVCTTAFTMTTSTGTITVKAYCGTANPPTDLILTGEIVTQPTAGQSLLKVKLPESVKSRYFYLTYTLSTGASAGAVDAWLGMDAQMNVP